MALFKKKHKDVENPQNVELENSAPKKTKANRKKNGMAQVLNESVPATVEDELKANEAFIHHDQGQERYVGLLFHVADIGGLDKKSRKVEAKGSLIEAINSGGLKTVITPDLMDKEELVFIPDTMTLYNMLDYSLLDTNPDTGEQIKYSLVHVEVNSNTNQITIIPIEPQVQMSFSEICTLISENEGTIDDILTQEDEDEESDDDLFGSGAFDGDDEPSDVGDDLEDDIPDLEDEIPDVPEIPDMPDSSFDDDIDAVDEIPNDDYTQPDYQGMDEGYGQGTDFDYGAAGTDGYGPVDGSGVQEQPHQQEDEVPDDWMRNVVIRKFYSDDLGLEITTEPFDAQFLQNNMFVPFDENRPVGEDVQGSWLNAQLNELARQANAEMSRMHKDNLFLMRERYFKLMSKHADRIQKDLDVNDERTQYGKIMASLRDARETEFASIDSRVARKKDDLEAAWKRKLQEVGQDAARAAQHQYRERYGKYHDEEINHLEDVVKSSIEDEYTDAVREVNERRRMEATKILDLGITEVLEEISDLYMSVLADENTRYQELQENMSAFADDNRRNDIARTNTLAEELRQKVKADTVLAEQTEKIRNLQAGWDAERQSLQAELEKMRRDNTAHISDLQARCDEQLARERDRNNELQRQLDAMRQSNENIYKAAREEYAHQIQEKNNEVAALHDRLGEAAEQHRRSNKLATYLVIAISICAIGIGFILGTYIRLGNDVKTIQQQSVQEYNQNATDSNQ